MIGIAPDATPERAFHGYSHTVSGNDPVPGQVPQWGLCFIPSAREIPYGWERYTGAADRAANVYWIQLVFPPGNYPNDHGPEEGPPPHGWMHQKGAADQCSGVLELGDIIGWEESRIPLPDGWERYTGDSDPAANLIWIERVR